MTKDTPERITLDFEQRQRASRLEAKLNEGDIDPSAVAAELIYLRDKVARFEGPKLTPAQEKQALQDMYDDLVGGDIHG